MDRVFEEPRQPHARDLRCIRSPTAKPHQVTDGLSDAISPAFDAGGKYLYFLASTNYGPTHRLARDELRSTPGLAVSIYLAVLARNRAVAAPAGGR